ncbi:MAG: sialate O-acetylesterase [Bacilli bacterium]|jgi:hypothetical protein|nr:sialate O-acetylesterase [Bacilli bacterium]
MKKTKIITIVLFALLLIGCRGEQSSNNLDDLSSGPPPKEAQAVILFGQSNMVGLSHNDYLNTTMPENVEEYKTGYENVKINFLNSGGNTSYNRFVPVKLGQGYSISRFGPEVGIAETLSKGNAENVFLIKYAVGATSLYQDWVSPSSNPEPGDLYVGAIEFTLNSLELLKEQGFNPKIKAICWMQGEHDSVKSYYEEYYSLTKNFVSDLRLAFDDYKEDNGIAFLDAAIAAMYKWREHETINNAKRQNAEEDPLTYFIDTNAEGLTTELEPTDNPDILHYDSASMIKLGRLFGMTLLDNSLVN